MRRTIFHKTMRRDAGNVDLTVLGGSRSCYHAPCIYSRAREPVELRYGRRENTKRKEEKKRDASITETEVREESE